MTQGGPPQQAKPQRQLGRRTKWPWVAGAGVLLLAVLIRERRDAGHLRRIRISQDRSPDLSWTPITLDLSDSRLS